MTIIKIINAINPLHLNRLYIKELCSFLIFSIIFSDYHTKYFNKLYLFTHASVSSENLITFLKNLK
jgi:hypothetical protein